MELRGEVKQILTPTTGQTARGEWQRQEVVFEYLDGQYSRNVAVTFFNKSEDVAKLSVGTTATFHFNVESKEYNGRWFTNLSVWRLSDIENTSPQGQPQSAPPVAQPPF